MALTLDFDLNSLPPDDLSFDYEGCAEGPLIDELDNFDSHINVEAISQSVRSSSRDVLSLDLNVDLNEDDSLRIDVVGTNEDNQEDNQEHSPIAQSGELFTDANQGEVRQRKYKTLSNDEKRAIYNVLLQRSENGKLKRNTTKEVSTMFSVPLRTVQQIWSRAKGTPVGVVVDVRDRRLGNSGRKRITIQRDAIANVPLNRRTTLRSLAEALKTSHRTVHKRLKEGLLRRHSNSIKPFLTEEHKIARLKFCISMLDPTSVPHAPRFVNMYNIVHIDEKWFYMTDTSVSYYLHSDEQDPVQTCKSKNFIRKVMFLAAIARPRFDEEGNEVFSGKIGLFPFVTKEPAIRRSRNREAGTLETKPMTLVNQKTIRAFLLQKVLPAIRAKWPPENARETIFIQQDNARTHVRLDDEEFRVVALQDGFDIRLLCQPANSPDMNVLDLGFFNAIQSLKDKECPTTVDQLIEAVQKAFDEYSAEKINRIFLTLQCCMRQTMIVGGSNTYKIPHLYKDRLERSGDLPTQIDCEAFLVENVKNKLSNLE